MKFPTVKSKTAMTPNERLKCMLASDATTHLEVTDDLLEAIRCIDGWFGNGLEWEPEMEAARNVMAAACLFMLPATDEDAEIDGRIDEEEFERRFVEAFSVYRQRSEHRFLLRAGSDDHQPS